MEQEIVFNAKAKVSNENGNIKPNVRKINGGSESYTIESVFKEINISQRQYDKLKADYEEVVVHDFGDEYHLSQEEKERRNRFYNVFSQIMKCKKKYRKLNEFITVYRKHMNCLYEVATANDGIVYSKEKFITGVMKGEIEVFGLKFPSYTGKDKKFINWEMVSEYIVDQSLDPNDLMPKDNSSINEDIRYMDDDEIDNMIERYFGSKDALDNVQDDEDDVIAYVDPDNLPDASYATALSSKETKKLLKNNPSMLNVIRKSSKKHHKSNVMNMMLYDMIDDDMEYIENSDKKKGIITDSQMPEFKGDILNDNDYKRYLYKLEEWKNNNIRYEYDGKYKTQAEINDIELKNELERSGWNVRKIYQVNKKEKRMKKAYKKDKKREEELKRRLTEVQNRNNKRKGKKSDELEFNCKSKKKKKGKKKDKLSRAKKNAKQEFDEILLDSVNKNDYDSFKDYSKEMEDFTFDSVFK